MDIFITVYIGLIGFLIGSFLNVVIYRLPHGETIVSGRSHCPTCGHPLSGLDLVPVFSFLLLGRRCRYCKAPISWRYMTVELTTGIFFAAVTFSQRPWISTAAAIGTATACFLFCILLADALIQYDGHTSLTTRLFFVAIGTIAIVLVIAAIIRLPAPVPLWDRLIGLTAGLLLLGLPMLGKPAHNSEIGFNDRKQVLVHPMAAALPIAGLSSGLLSAWPVLAVGLVLYLALLAVRKKQPSSRLSAWLGRLLPLLVLIAFAILLISDCI